MASGVFLIQEDGSLIEMEEQPYNSEDHLQILLERYPNLMAGDQIDDMNPRRWLLISREIGLPAEEDGSDRWSVDHLFLDQDAIPTLVEVKRSSDNRIRREVVGQMLDYAANAVVYWPVEEIRAKFDATCRANALDPEKLLSDFLDQSDDSEAFWLKAKTNLQAGKIRMLFVADEIPNELRRVVEFLNEQMNPAEVLAVEIKQFAGQGFKSLVPRVHGQTEEAKAKKNSRGTLERQWDEESFFKELRSRRGNQDAEIARKILDWAKNRLARFWWGKGKQDGSVYPLFDYMGETYYPFCIWTYGKIEILFQRMMIRPPFSDETLRKELLSRLNQIPGVSIPENATTRRPNIFLSLFSDTSSLKQLLETLDWVVDEIKAS
ncbi:MAG: hypothetical protein QUS07_04630 [Methanothrix sp.]|nr:hypothetical protein [Methanothrix sp.]